MMRELILVGVLALAFGFGALRVQGDLDPFSGLNLGIGFAALVGAAVFGLRRLGRVRQAAHRGPLLETTLITVAVVWGAVLVERAAAFSEVRFDWTFERRFELAPGMQTAVDNLHGRLRMTLYSDAGDPRTRRTRLLLEEIARTGDVELRERDLDEYADEADRFEIGTSNSVVLELGSAWETVERPIEGTLFEAISRLGVRGDRVVYVTVGTGEGDLEETAKLGYSGLAVALQNEGYSLRTLSMAFVTEVPADADAVIAIAPERAFRPESLDALRRYLRGGGSLIAFLEPGSESGIEHLLAEFGITPTAGVIVDPASGAVDGERQGLSPIAFNYSEHPVTHGLNRNRMTFFRRARSFALRKPDPSDVLRAVVHASGQSWLHDDSGDPSESTVLARPQLEPPGYHPIVVTGRYRRDGAETRIVAFGDSDFASNRYLRALYNLDLVVNAVHWIVKREAAITLRPKAAQLIQFPVPIQNSLRALFGVGLLVPELLLVTAGLLWLRRRTA